MGRNPTCGEGAWIGAKWRLTSDGVNTPWPRPQRAVSWWMIIFNPRIAAFALSLFTAGCTSSQEPARPPTASVAGSYWIGDTMVGPPSVRISLSEQRAYFYKGDQLAGVSLVSTGREGRRTTTGDFHIVEKQRYHESSLFGNYVNSSGKVVQGNVDTRKHRRPKGARYAGAPMPFWMRIVGGTGMHEGQLPGYPASHGCIRMPREMAEAFYRSLEVGTPVTIAK